MIARISSPIGEARGFGVERMDRLAAAFWAYGSAQSEFGRAFARAMHLHQTDAAAMVEVVRSEDQGEPLTPARLAERTGLTSAGVAVLLNRLEDAGHLERRRGHADRRKVTLHAAGAMRAAAEAFYAPVREAVDILGRQRTEEELQAIEEFMVALQRALDFRSRLHDD
jgi:DNA-binding MarR family transcriptional regulator